MYPINGFTAMKHAENGEVTMLVIPVLPQTQAYHGTAERPAV